MRATIVAFLTSLMAFRAKLPDDADSFQLRVDINKTMIALENLNLRLSRYEKANPAKK